MGDDERDRRLRSAMGAHLARLAARLGDGPLRSAEINSFSFEGRPMPLLVQSGIWKPAGFEAALTIRTTFTPAGRAAPYEDRMGVDGLLRYDYRSSGPAHADNRALRQAMIEGKPLAYFVGTARGQYLPVFPVWIQGEDPASGQVIVAVDQAQTLADPATLTAPQRVYAARLTRARVHQRVFRARVLDAYAQTCAVCRLRRHPELLDAAHILPDGHPRGDPVVPNGLSLCKIHHAAYDHDIVGIRPDLVIEVRAEVLSEIDGPMLRHGLQEMAGRQIVLPRHHQARPDPERLEVRYEEFRRAG